MQQDQTSCEGLLCTLEATSMLTCSQESRYFGCWQLEDACVAQTMQKNLFVVLRWVSRVWQFQGNPFEVGATTVGCFTPAAGCFTPTVAAFTQIIVNYVHFCCVACSVVSYYSA